MNKSLLATWVTLLVMLALGASYFFIYIPTNERRLQEQRFRSLQNIDRNIHTKIDNGVAMLNLLIKAYHDAPTKRDSLRKYIANYPADKFILTQPTLVKRGALLPDSVDFYKVLINNATGRISLQTQLLQVNKNNDSAVYQMSMHFNSEQFIKMLLPSNVFDEYIIFSNGKPLYQSFPAGISRVNNDSLLSVRNGISGSMVRNFTVSGNDYKLFLQPVYVGNNECVIGGLLSDSRYQQEKTQLPAQVVLLLVTLVLIILLSTPWLKLYQMGSKDRLTISDAISTVVIAMLLMSILFFMFFSYNESFKNADEVDEKSRLSESILKAFKKEIDTAYHKLAQFDTLVNYTDGDIVNFGKPSISFNDGRKIAVQDRVLQVSKNFSIKQLYWLDSSGSEIINWNSDTVNAPHGNFKGRSYFERIRNGSYYLLNNDVGKPYYLDQLVSRTTGAFTTVISIPSKYNRDSDSAGNYVAGMSFNVKSLKQVVVPAGFQFALVDNSGKVLYHSDSARNLNENLLNEFAEKVEIKSFIEANAKGYFATSYYSRNYYVHVTPVSDLPYFLVMMEDAGYKETIDTEVYSFTFSSMLLFFGFMVVQMVVTFLVSSKRSFFKKQVYNTSWIGPKKSAHRQYNLSIISNIAIIILLIIYLQFSSFLLYTFVLLFSVTFLSLFLNSVFAKKYENTNPANYQFKKRAIRWLFICIIVLDIVGTKILSPGNMWLLLSFEVVAFAIGIPLYLQGDKVLNRIRKTKVKTIPGRWNYINSFSLMAFTRLIVSSGIPVMFFYISAYNYEQHLDTRYKQLQFGKQVISKIPNTQLPAIQNELPYQSGIYIDSSSIAQIKVFSTTNTRDSIPQYSKEDDKAIALLNLSRLHISNNAVEDDKFYNASAADHSFYHNHILAKARKKAASVTVLQTKIPGTWLSLTSSDLNYHFPKLFCNEHYCRGLLYWLLLIAILAVFYITLTNIIKKLFSLNIPDLTKWKALDEAVIADKKLSNLVFVIGLPGAGKLSRLLEKISNQTIAAPDGSAYKFDKNDEAANDVFIADLMNIPDSGDQKEENAEWKTYVEKIFDKKNRLVIINHFEYNMQDGFTSRIKLNLLERIMLQNSSRVMILSTIHPVAFLDSVFDQSSKPTIETPGQDLERWHVLLGHYRIVVFPLEDNVPEGIYTRLEQSILNETRKTHFLNKMQEATIKVSRQMAFTYNEGKQADELAFKMQMTAHYFYMYIWQSLTKEEKFLLYDLAEDNLVNSFDDYNLNMLICKGVIIRSDGSLKLFNNGFRNFILTAIGNLEAMKIKNQIKDNGNWNRLKYPLFIIMAAILLFLLVSQQEAYSKIITYAATLATGIPLVMKLFSIFDSGKEKTA
ncbi:MAG: cache domain-containing protein [Bacteroidota bacterium]